MTYSCRKCGKTITFEPDDPLDDIEIMADLASCGWLFSKKYGFLCPDCTKEEEEMIQKYEPSGVDERILKAIIYSKTFSVELESGTWTFGDDEITFTRRSNGEVDRIYSNGMLFGRVEK